MLKKKSLTILFKPYISILFLHDFRAGILLALLSFLVPSVGILGLISVLGTIAFAEILKFRAEYLQHGFYLYNSLLVGFGIGFFYKVTFATVFLAILLGIFTFVLSFGLKRIFEKYNLPLLSLPFSLVSILFYLASLRYSNLSDITLYREPLIDIALPWSNLWQSFGEIFFLPYNLAGLFIAIVILWYSRILFLVSVAGYLVGIGIHSLFIQWGMALNSLYNFNFILIAMAIGAIFTIPHVKSYLLSFIAVGASVIVIDAMEVFFNLYNLPVYTIPFNIVVLLFILLLWAGKYELFAYEIKKTPEKTLVNFLDKRYRFGLGQIHISLPFFGTWQVYQGFNGKWTHKGIWKYAYDFIKVENGKSYKNSGEFLEDYYAFGEDVVSPVNGYVVAVRSDLQDNPIGVVDRVNNWGNYIIIHADAGYFVEISHLMQYSVTVDVGNYVRVGEIIAKCGNSGYSPQPHIHIQVQDSPALGAKTIPFCFTHFLHNGTIKFFELPYEEALVAPIRPDSSMVARLSLVLDEKYVYEVIERGVSKGRYSFYVAMDDAGKFYLDDGQNRLYFYNDGIFFYFYDYEGYHSYLKEIFKAVPKFVLSNGEFHFQEILPLYLRYSGLQKTVRELLLAFFHKHYVETKQFVQQGLLLKSHNSLVKLELYNKGFETIEVGELLLRRVYE